MSAGVYLPTADTATVDLSVTTDCDGTFFEFNGAFVAEARIAGRDTVSGDIFAAKLAVVVSVIGGVLTIGPVATIVPLYAPALTALAVDLVADPPNSKVNVRIIGNGGLTGQFADVDVDWSVWGSV